MCNKKLKMSKTKHYFIANWKPMPLATTKVKNETSFYSELEANAFSNHWGK
jgi:hypothetical protein